MRIGSRWVQRRGGGLSDCGMGRGTARVKDRGTLICRFIDLRPPLISAFLLSLYCLQHYALHAALCLLFVSGMYVVLRIPHPLSNWSRNSACHKFVESECYMAQPLRRGSAMTPHPDIRDHRPIYAGKNSSSALHGTPAQPRTYVVHAGSKARSLHSSPCDHT